LALVIAVTSTGALFPGPLFFANIALGGKKGGRAGLGVALGHSIVEGLLISAIGLGISSLLEARIKEAMSLVLFAGGTAMLFYGFLQLKDTVVNGEISSVNNFNIDSSLMTGIVLSGLNPHFIIWWLSTGTAILLPGITLFGPIIIPIFFLTHIWIDFLWLGLTAHLAYKGSSLLSMKGYRILLLSASSFLVVLGVYFIIQAIASVPLI